MLIANAFNILSEANAKIASLGVDYVNQAGTPKQPRTLRQLIRVKQLYNIVSKFIFLNDAGTAITGTFGQNDAAINRLLIQLKWKAEINTFPNIPNPVNTFNPSSSTGDFLPEGNADGDLLVFDDGAWTVFSKGADTYVLTSTPTGLVWAAGGATGLPSGGSTGQVLKKNSGTSYDVVWAGIATTDITGVTASAAEINILDGVTGVSAAEIGYLANVTSDIQTQFTSKLSTGLTDGYFLVGNVSNVATAVAPTGDVIFDNAGVFTISPGVIDNADINSAAGISRTKLADGNSYRVIINDNTGAMAEAAGITASRVLISDANGIPTHSSVTTTTLGYLDPTSSIQTQLNNRLTVSLTSPAQGDLILYNGTNWVNLAVGTSGQVLTSNGSTAIWGNSTANGIPAGGSTNQILRKASATDYDTEWHSFVTADITDLSTTVTELNQLSGVTVTAAEFNRLAGLTGGTLQAQLANKLSSSLTYNSIFVGNGSHVASQLSAGSDGYILTIVSGSPTWQAPTAPGDVTGPGSSTDNALVRFDGVTGALIQESGIIVDDSDNLTFPTGAALQTGTTATNTLLLQAYDVDGTAYVTFGTLTANNDPTFDLNQLVTVNGDLIYRSILGQPLAAPTGSEAGQSIRWNAGGTAWEYFTPGSGGGDVTGPVSSTDNAIMRWDGTGGDTAQDSGIIVDDTNNISGIASMTVATGGALRTGTTATNTLLLQAYDVDGTAYTTFATLTAGNTPTMDLATGVTIGSVYIYRVGGTDVSLADGGTGASLTNPGADRIMFWDDSAGAVTWLSVDSTLLITDTTLSSVFGAEEAQDAVGAMLANTTTINLTYSDATPSLSAAVNDGSITYAKIQNVAANTFLANATGSAATVQEISTTRIPLFVSAITGTPSAGTYLTGDGNWTANFALTDGSGTTANGTAVDLGGTTTGAVTISTDSSYPFLLISPAGASGIMGIYSLQTNKEATILIDGAANYLQFQVAGNGTVTNIKGTLRVDYNSVYLRYENAGQNKDITNGVNGIIIRDQIDTNGMAYSADYSTNGVIDYGDRWIPDRGYVLGAKTYVAAQTFAAGTATSGTAPLYLQSGTALTTPANGALEYHSSHLYFTIGSTRYQLDQQSGLSVATDAIWDASGDLAVGTGSNTATRLAIGATNQVLLSNGTTATWSYNANQKTVATSTYTVVDADFGYQILFTNSTGCTVTIDNAITIDNFWFSGVKGTAMTSGDVTFSAGSTTLNTVDSALTISEVSGGATWSKIGASTVWYGFGALGTGGGGIVNTATANELAKSDGTDIGSSGIFSTTDGNVTLGSGSISGDRTILVSSSTSVADLILSSQGLNSEIRFTNTGTNVPVVKLTLNSSYPEVMLKPIAATTAHEVFLIKAHDAVASSAQAGYLRIEGGDSAQSGINAGAAIIFGGTASVGNANSGGVIINPGGKSGTGLIENIYLNSGSLTGVTSMQGGVVLANSTADPTATANAVAIYAKDISASSVLHVFNEAGDVIKLYTPNAGSAYSVTNGTTDRTFDANSYTTDELADVLATLISDLKLTGLIA